VRSPLTYATLITLILIVPIAVMEGRPGEFFGPLALAYAVAVAAAMVVALTVTPALSLLLFSAGTPARRGSPLVRRLVPRYGAALSRFVRRPRTALIAAGACVVVALAVVPFLGTSPIPTFKDRHVLVHLDGEPGMSNPRTTAIATEIGRDLRAIPGVENVGAHVGRAVTGDQRVDVNSSEVWVTIDSDADYDATMTAIDEAVGRVQEVEHDVVTYTSQRIRDVGALDQGTNPVTGDGLDVLTGSDKPLVVRVYGQDLDVLQREADGVREAVASIDGVADPQVVRPIMQDTLEIEVDLDRARAEGIKPGDVRRAQTTLLQGLHVGSVFQAQKVFDVVVQGVPETRTSVDAVRNLLIDRPEGGHVRLGDVAAVRVGQTPVSINRDAVSRHVDVVADLDGRSLDSVAADVEDRLADLTFPLEYHAQVLETSTSDEIGATRILAAAIAAAIAIFLLLQAAFQSWRLAAVAYLSLPVALAGGVLAALVNGADLSLGALLGLLAVFGLAARNGVVLIRHFQDLERHEAERFGVDLIRRGAEERLTPILTTASALALAALPFVILADRPGLEVVGPMAVVILGGLVTSTFLSLFVLPALYLRFAAGVERVRVPEHDEIVVRRRFQPAGAGAVVVVPGAGDGPSLPVTGANGGGNGDAGPNGDGRWETRPDEDRENREGKSDAREPLL
jgi:Cu/Ag efflux pump CusA